ncbi:hypothetical protein GH714_004569 [Hevea brasiliensis]|uniref:GrpE protein homolog n=1 Tax=Hevea brasiliensis TaxID=3981 RepID=A0A6A6KJ07_HEVBR|nr:hypothetical protein GH714_004569 [Hevea brasiliensis]
MEERLLGSEAKDISDLKGRIWIENKKIWKVGFPAALARVTQYGMFVVTQSFIGHAGKLQLAGYALIQIIAVRFANGILVASLTEELSIEKDQVLRISADFDNFRKRTERERLSLVTNAQGEVVESLLPILDNFERAKSQIKLDTEGEAKINNSYQSIYKQFLEILGSLGVLSVETRGNPFDPLLHEAIMREDSVEFEEGIILEEFRKGFKLGDRLLRPSMVKVSSGPGPAKPQQVGSSGGAETASETTEDSREPVSS